MSSISSSQLPDHVRLINARSLALWRAARRAAFDILLVATGLTMAMVFDAGHYLPTSVCVVLLFVLAGVGLARCRFAPFSPLTRLMLTLYSASFIGCYGYLLNENHLWFDTSGAVAYMSDPVTTRIMLMTGLIGLLGLLTGYVLASQRPTVEREIVRATRTLKPLPFLIVLFAAFLFAYINVPTETIFSSVYTAARGLAGSINFNAASMVGFTLLMLLIIDAEQETMPAAADPIWKSRTAQLRRSWKSAAVLVTTVLIVVILLLHGRRDSFGYLVGLAAMYLTEPLPAETGRTIRRRRFAFLSVAGATVLIIFLAAGDIRTRVAVHDERPFLEAIKYGVTEGFTGTAVLLTNLSLAHSYRFGEMVVEHGGTYGDYLRSLPPGFVTYALGIERPIEVNRGPNFWFTDISAGGVHVVTVPFKNFLAPGAFLIMLLYGYFIARSEVVGQRSHWLPRFWYGSLFVCAALWFWYGDMNLIREIMIFSIAGVLYAMARRVSSFSRRAEAPVAAR